MDSADWQLWAHRSTGQRSVLHNLGRVSGGLPTPLRTGGCCHPRSQGTRRHEVQAWRRCLTVYALIAARSNSTSVVRTQKLFLASLKTRRQDLWTKQHPRWLRIIQSGGKHGKFVSVVYLRLCKGSGCLNGCCLCGGGLNGVRGRSHRHGR
jgi:hypothetical protein